MDFEYIDLKRREKNLTVTELCARAEIDRSTYYNLKQNQDIRLSTLRKLFEIFHQKLINPLPRIIFIYLNSSHNKTSLTIS